MTSNQGPAIHESTTFPDPDEGEQQPLIQQPLIRPMEQKMMGNICWLSVVAALVMGWCVLDSWNRDVSTQLFGLEALKNEHLDEKTGEMTGDRWHPFDCPLSLAFFQFFYMGLVFTGLWFLLSRNRPKDYHRVRENIFSPQWVGLVTTHVFSTFWLQALMIPSTLMTPMVFAASRSLEVPLAAAIRSKVIGGRFGGHPIATIALMCGAGILVKYSHIQIGACLCLWSGHGVELAGIAFFLIYVCVIALPAANAVCLESVMVEFDTNPILMLAVMNIIACACFFPVLVFAHIIGLENVIQAFFLTFEYRQLYMLVLWLSTQMVMFSVVGLSLISTVDSFWAVACFSCFKPAYWWLSKLSEVFFFTESILSIDKPDASFWGFVLTCGVTLVAAAAIVDSNSKESAMETKDFEPESFTTPSKEV